MPFIQVGQALTLYFRYTMGMIIKLGNFGTRTRPFSGGLHQNFLVIGLGQVGLLALAGVHTMLSHALPPRTRQGQTRLLAIAQRQSIRQEQLLPREFRLLLEQEVLPWSDVPGRYAAEGVAQWWSRTPHNPTLQADPSSSRLFGRLMLWTNAELVGETLFENVNWLQLSSLRENHPRTVLILASLAESEGSGMVFDVVGRIRKLLVNTPTQLVGVFTADAPFKDGDEQRLAMANVYASLKEIDASNLQPESYPHTLPLIGRPHSYQPGSPQALLDAVCITGDTHAPIAHPEDILAEFAVTWLLNAAVVPAQSILPPGEPRIDEQRRFRTYAAFNVAKLALPVHAALEAHMIEAAKSVLKSMLIDYQDPVNDYVNKVLARCHKALYTQHNLLDHHLLIDKLRELRRRLSPSQLKGGTKVRGGLVGVLQAEWERLKTENEPIEQDPLSQVSIPRDVVRKRMDDALDENFRPLLQSLEALAVSLAFEEGWGLPWTLRLFDSLLKEVDASLTYVKQQILAAQQDLERSRRRWLVATDSTLEALGEQLLAALLHWIVQEAREGYWAELLRFVDDLTNRLELASKQIPDEMQHLEERGAELREALEVASTSPPLFPGGVLCNEVWLGEGTRSIPSVDTISPRELLTSVFKRWNPGDLPPTRQIQKFPMEVLNATRLTLQSYSSFLPLHDFILQFDGTPMMQQISTRFSQAAAPTWTAKAITNKLDDTFQSPRMIQLVREVAAPFSAVPLLETEQHITRLSVPSPDPDEVLLVRLMYGWTAEHVQRLRGDYRRAYHHVAADNVPLHIDRRWETTMADLVHTSLRSEVGELWDTTYMENQHGAVYAQASLRKLANTLALALNADPTQLQVVSPLVVDTQMFIYPLQPFRLKIPPPLCAFVFLLAQGSTAEAAENLYRTVTANMLEENFFFVVNLTGRGDVDALLEPLRAQSYLPLELTESDIKHIASAPKPTNALRDIVISRINLAAISPFYTRAPVPDHMFFGREKEIADVRSKLATHSVVLIGGRRIGKTSTLQKIYRALMLSDSPILPMYLDCSNVMRHHHFFRRIARDWQIALDNMDDPIEFDEVVAQLSARSGGRMPVFLLDEVDRLLKTDQADGFDEPLFRTFRSLSNEKRCQFVFSGEKLLLTSINNAHSVLFNFPKQVKLNPLRKDVVRRLVSEPFEMLNIWLEEADDLIQQVYDISAGHPNIVQTICHALVEVIDQDKQVNLLKRSHLGRALDMHQVQVDIVETIWGQMHPLAKLVTLLWSETTHQMSLEELVQMIHKAGLTMVLTQDVKDFVIPDLELYNFIRQEGRLYTLIPIHFPTILDFMTDKKVEIKAILEKYQQS